MRSQNWILWCRLQVHVRLKKKLNEVLLAMDIEDNRIEEAFAYPWVKLQQKRYRTI